MSEHLSAAEIALVRSSFERIKPEPEAAAAMFYARLFEIAPETQPLFRSDMDVLGRKFMQTLAVIVATLDDMQAIRPSVNSLAKRHVGYGVTAQHYALAGAALLWMIERRLGEAWTAQTAEAWQNAYRMLSGVMIGEAYGPGAVRR